MAGDHALLPGLLREPDTSGMNDGLGQLPPAGVAQEELPVGLRAPRSLTTR
jgi:hypothetical protein